MAAAKGNDDGHYAEPVRRVGRGPVRQNELGPVGPVNRARVPERRPTNFILRVNVCTIDLRLHPSKVSRHGRRVQTIARCRSGMHQKQAARQKMARGADRVAQLHQFFCSASNPRSEGGSKGI